MMRVKSIFMGSARNLFLTFFALASLLPVLFMVYLISENVFPFIEASHVIEITSDLTYVFLAVLLLPLCSFFITARWIRAFEAVIREIQSKNREIVEGRAEFSSQCIELDGTTRRCIIDNDNGGAPSNEMHVLVDSVNSIYQTATDQIGERQRLRELLSKMIVISSNLTSELDFNRLFPNIIGEVTRVMAAERTSLYVVDWDSREMWTKVAEGIDQFRMPIGKGISGRVVETGETINVHDAWELPYFDRTFDEKNNFRTKSVLCMPITSRSKERIGVLQVINKQEKACFNEEDEVVMQALVAQVGIALENSLLIEEISLSFRSFIVTLSAMVDARHPLTAGHSERVTEYSLHIAEEMRLPEQKRELLKYAALLHDIGKIGVRDDILLKEGVYTTDERTEMNSHAAGTRVILTKFHFPRHLSGAAEIACHHHERWDGQGYPDGLAGGNIPLLSRIIAVSDVFDALTSKRDYPKYTRNTILSPDPLPLDKAVAIILDGAGTEFDRDVVSAFMRCLPKILTRFRAVRFSPEYVDDFLMRLGA